MAKQPTDEPKALGFLVAPTHNAVPAARRRVMEAVRGWGLGVSEERLDDLRLLTSEVITNAIVHTHASCAVHVRWTGSRIRLEATDTGAGRPRKETAAPDEESGRGLLLVSMLSAAWGTRSDRAGKVVWFELTVSTDPLPTRRSATPLTGVNPFARYEALASGIGPGALSAPFTTIKESHV